jgi:parallel beta-helix repeat protein
MVVIMNRLVVVAGALLLVLPCAGRTITVDADGAGDYQDIQSAVDVSRNGDAIVVRPGTYRGQIKFFGRNVTVRSEDPEDPAVVQATVITSGDDRPSVVFDLGEGALCVLDGFTITGRGILCAGASPTISRNVIRNCAATGIRGQAGAAPTIINNTIASNQQEGINACDGPILGNTISQNRGGIGFCDGTIGDNLVSENGDAGGLYSCDGQIVGNVIVGNYVGTEGAGLYSCGGAIANNIIAGNQAGVAGGGLFDCTGAITNNTIVGNRAGARGGAMSQCPSTVRDNIIAFNSASAGGGIYGPCSNTYNAFWNNVGGDFGGGATSGVGVILTDPSFVADGFWDDRGTAETDDDLWINGDYHLQSSAGRWDPQRKRWVTDALHSGCIDAGDPSSNFRPELWPHGQRINLGAYGGTPEASMSQAELGRLTDLDDDGRVGPFDLKLLAEAWLAEEELLAPDFNRDLSVDLRDFAMLAMDWRIGPPPPQPPVPNPMTWAVRPFPTGPTSTAMVATTATSTDGTGVAYFFEDFFHPEFNSGWLVFPANVEPRWEDTGLQPETTYWYRVKARNRGNLLETEWSQRFAATTQREDFSAPEPNPLVWESEPRVSGPGTIRMTAAPATDESGVEYEFQCTSHPEFGSGWQDSPTYEVTGLPNSTYTFRARARDKSVNQNTTRFTQDVSVDLDPPTPDPMQWESAPEKVKLGSSNRDYHATMTAVEATDVDEPIEYFFECTNQPGFSSGWQTDRTYTVLLGGPNVSVRFRVKARDASGNETDWSPELPAL